MWTNTELALAVVLASVLASLIGWIFHGLWHWLRGAVVQPHQRSVIAPLVDALAERRKRLKQRAKLPGDVLEEITTFREHVGGYAGTALARQLEEYSARLVALQRDDKEKETLHFRCDFQWRDLLIESARKIALRFGYRVDVEGCKHNSITICLKKAASRAAEQ